MVDIIDTVVHFVFNWTTYFVSLPIWFTIYIILIKWIDRDKIKAEDLLASLIFSLLNPIWYLFFGFLIMVFPFVLIFLWLADGNGVKIKDPNLF